jgi:hypothetical protein
MKAGDQALGYNLKKKKGKGKKKSNLKHLLSTWYIHPTES